MLIAFPSVLHLLSSFDPLPVLPPCLLPSFLLSRNACGVPTIPQALCWGLGLRDENKDHRKRKANKRNQKYGWFFLSENSPGQLEDCPCPLKC